MGVLYSKCDDKELEKLAKQPTMDIFRSNPLRWLGYAGHLGICSNVLSPKIVNTGKMVATAYILGDVFQKASYAAKRRESDSMVIKRSMDALMFQLLASVIIPGFIMSRTRKITRTLLRKFTDDTCGPNSSLMKWGPCLLGLLLAPLIMKPIDNTVNYILSTAYDGCWCKDLSGVDWSCKKTPLKNEKGKEDWEAGCFSFRRRKL